LNLYILTELWRSSNAAGMSLYKNKSLHISIRMLACHAIESWY